MNRLSPLVYVDVFLQHWFKDEQYILCSFYYISSYNLLLCAPINLFFSSTICVCKLIASWLAIFWLDSLLFLLENLHHEIMHELAKSSRKLFKQSKISANCPQIRACEKWWNFLFIFFSWIFVHFFVKQHNRECLTEYFWFIVLALGKYATKKTFILRS